MAYAGERGVVRIVAISSRSAASVLAVATLSIALAGCTSSQAGGALPTSSVTTDSPIGATSATGSPPSDTAPSGNARQHVAYSFDLFHHCGLDKVPFGGRMWRSDAAAPTPEPGADGMVTYNGSTHGVMVLVAADRAEFTYQGSPSSPPKVIVFTPTTGTPLTCA